MQNFYTRHIVLAGARGELPRSPPACERRSTKIERKFGREISRHDKYHASEIPPSQTAGAPESQNRDQKSPQGNARVAEDLEARSKDRDGGRGEPREDGPGAQVPHLVRGRRRRRRRAAPPALPFLSCIRIILFLYLIARDLCRGLFLRSCYSPMVNLETCDLLRIC